jgi:hypothetical protein
MANLGYSTHDGKRSKIVEERNEQLCTEEKMEIRLESMPIPERWRKFFAGILLLQKWV